MDKSKLRLFHTTKEVETHFDSFLDTVSQGGISFRSGRTRIWSQRGMATWPPS